MCWGLSESNIIQPTLLLCPCRVSKHVSLAMGYCEYSVVAESSNEWELMGLNFTCIALLQKIFNSPPPPKGFFG